MPRVTLSFSVPWKWRRELEDAFGPLDRDKAKKQDRLAGYPVSALVEQVRRELGIKYPVRIVFNKREARAAATRPYGRIGSIHLQTASTLRRKMPELSKEERKAKVASQVCEELAGHLANREVCHTKRVVGSTLKCMNRHLTKRQLRTPLIQQKIQVLKAAPSDPDDCPLGPG